MSRYIAIVARWLLKANIPVLGSWARRWQDEQNRRRHYEHLKQKELDEYYEQRDAVWQRESAAAARKRVHPRTVAPVAPAEVPRSSGTKARGKRAPTRAATRPRRRATKTKDVVQPI